jgi:uncharacterized protein (DUF1015 family)
LAEIQAFRGILFDVAPGELGRVIAPPYDVIPPDYRDELYGRDPRNIVRVILNRHEGDAAYADAAAHFERFQAEGVLRRDEQPALYVLEQTFQAQDRTHTRRGLLARFRAEPPETGAVLPHEQTRAAAKEDRYKLLLATRANFSPIFLMLSDPQRAFAAELRAAAHGAPALDVTDDGDVRQRLWRVTDPAAIERFRGHLRARAYIADGHHRYATALRYAATPGGTPFTLGYFTPLGDDGLVVLPYHRILSEGPTLDQARAKLGELFELHDARGTHEAAEKVARSAARHAFALVQPGAGGLVAEARPAALELLPADTPACLRALDTYFLHRAVLGPLLGVRDEAVSYVHSLGEAEQAVGEDRCRLAVLLRATPVQQIVDVSEARESMPAKSTFFHPKLPSGLVIHALAE